MVRAKNSPSERGGQGELVVRLLVLNSAHGRLPVPFKPTLLSEWETSKSYARGNLGRILVGSWFWVLEQAFLRAFVASGWMFLRLMPAFS